MFLNEFDQICVIISTASKNYDDITRKIENKFSNILDKNKYKIHLTKDADSVTNIAHDFAISNPGQLIITVGGDGSLGETVNAIRGKDVLFAFLPNGTGNDFSRTIYPKLSFDQILDKVESLEIKDIDLIRVNDELCLNAFSFGFESQVLKKSLELKDKLGKFKKLSIISAVALNLTKLTAYKYKFTCKLADGSSYESINDRYITAVTNGRFYGTGFQPAPHAEIDDGILNFNSLKKDKFVKLLRFLAKYKSEKHMKLPISENFELVSGRIESLDGPMIGNIDGNMREFTNIDFEVLNKALKLGIFNG